MLLNWYSYSITGIWNCIGRLCEKSFHAIIKLGFLPNAFFVLTIAFLFVLWMFIMRKLDSQSKDKGLIE